jgi:hypothetical protein
VFDHIKTNVIDAIARGNHEVTRAAGILDIEVTEQCRALDESLTSTVRIDYLQIVNDLAKDRRKSEPDTMVNPPDWQIRAFVGDNGHVPRFDLAMFSGPTTDYGFGHAHGGFIDSAFMDNIQQLTD